VKNSNLSIEVSESANLKIMRLYDTSFYHKDELISNYLIEVLPVNKTDWLTFNVNPKFSLVLNSSNLKYRSARSYEDLIDLPDGIYEFKQSYKPNYDTVVHYLHFRTSEISNRLQQEFCKLLNNKCSLSRMDYDVNKRKLRDIEEYIKAAKWMVEEERCKQEGKDLYSFAKELLDKYTNECKC
jgi:hypothetical protein